MSDTFTPPVRVIPEITEQEWIEGHRRWEANKCLEKAPLVTEFLNNLWT